MDCVRRNISIIILTSYKSNAYWEMKHFRYRFEFLFCINYFFIFHTFLYNFLPSEVFFFYRGGTGNIFGLVWSILWFTNKKFLKYIFSKYWCRGYPRSDHLPPKWPLVIKLPCSWLVFDGNKMNIARKP